MIDHVGVTVSDIERSRRFYEAALEPLGISVLMEIPPAQDGSGGSAIGFGSGESAIFWIGNDKPVSGRPHIAFRATSRNQVDRFHAAALGAGGKDNGSPGTRADYSPNYYAAFVYDPDGANIEAVCHEPA